MTINQESALFPVPADHFPPDGGQGLVADHLIHIGQAAVGVKILAPDLVRGHHEHNPARVLSHHAAHLDFLNAGAADAPVHGDAPAGEKHGVRHHVAQQRLGVAAHHGVGIVHHRAARHHGADVPLAQRQRGLQP